MTQETDLKLKKLPFYRRPSSFVAFFCIMLIGTGLYTLYLLVATSVGEQYSIFFGGPYSPDTFMDFFNVLKYISGRNPYHYTEYFSLAEKAYPPLAYLLLYPFSQLFDYANNTPPYARGSQFGLMSAVFYVGASSLLLFLLIYHYKKGTGVSKTLTVIALGLSGVFLFSLERANTVMLTAVFLGAFLFWYDSPNKWLRELSYMALACAAALKVYPVIFGILLLKDRRWFAAGRTMVYGAMAFFLPFLFFEGGFSNFSQLLSNVDANSEAYRFVAPTYRFGWLAFHLWNNPEHPHYESWILVGNVLLVLGTVLCLLFKQNWKAVTLLTCALVATPVNSAYYCGLYFFPAIILFLNAREHRLMDWLYMIAFLLILNPYQIIHENTPITVPIANIALLIMFLLLILETFFYLGKLLFKKYRRLFHPEKIREDSPQILFDSSGSK